jgi:hypothetical protein
VYVANRTLKCGRQDELLLFWRGTSSDVIKNAHDVRSAAPLADEDGTIDDERRAGYFTAANVAAAGPSI